MINLNEEYKICANNNKKILNEVKTFLKSNYNATDNDLIENCEWYIRKLLTSLKTSNNQVVELRIERGKIRDDLTDLERAYCQGDNCDINESGFNNGLKPNKIMEREIEKMQLKEKLGELFLKTRLIEHSLLRRNEMVKKFINCIPQPQNVSILNLAYINCMANGEIAEVLNYSYDYVKHARIRAIESMCEIFKLSMSPFSLKNMV